MNALVVYESMFGNTKQVAQAIASGLANDHRVRLAEVSEAPMTVGDDIDLLIVGGPTHAFGLSRPDTRDSARRQAQGNELVSKGIGLREWLQGAAIPAGVPIAAFDTKAKKPRLPGSAARSAQRRLRKSGHPAARRATSFYVNGTRGPLVEGELERAQRWGSALAAQVPALR